MSLDLTSFAPALKSYYTRDKVENMVYKDNPFLAMLPKMEDFFGANLPIPIIYGNPTGRSAAFATAQANKNNSLLKAFTLTRARDYSLASIDNETLEAAQSDKGAFMEAATLEINGAMNSCARSLATSLFRDGSGSIGRINSTVAGTTLTLVTPADIVNFEVGQKIQFSSAATSATLRDAGEALTITTIDRTAGSMGVSANLNTISGITSQDFINVQGDIEAKVKGLDAWLPTTVSAASFFGVDRTSDATRLGGVRYDGGSQPIEEALLDGLALCAREGGSPDYAFINYANFSNLEKALGSKVSYVNLSPEGLPTVGFRGMLINGPKGPVKVVADQNCQAAVSYLIQMDTWKLYSLGMSPKILDSDGMKMLRESSADSVEIRCGYYAQLGCRAPGFNARITLAS